MIRPTQPGLQYDYNNESQFRTQVQQADGLNVKKNEAVDSLIMIDQTDGAPYRVTLVSGVLTVTAVPL